MIAQAVGILQWTIYAVLFAGDWIFRTLGVQPPEIVKIMQENKMHTILGVFMVSSFAQKLLVTGAFEVTYNGKLIFSKLESGHMPNGPIIEDMINKVARL
mgnify:CR=1 FL=1|mmetsp:Transcript_9130/g.13241  ORF Transcript_9130/g.13241 Transcript_9130/m.13241 type:complete len:100 (-) Transcript_9130:115-414(-)